MSSSVGRTLAIGFLGSVCFIGVAYAAESTTYRYDALGRLVRVSGTGGSQNGEDTTYSFDAAGNRTNVTTSGAPAPTPSPTPTPIGNSGRVTDYSFEQPDVGGSFQYDPSVGNAYFGGGAGIQANGSAWAFASAPNGEQTGFVQNDKDGNGNASTIVVNVYNLTVGATYVVRFRMARRQTADPANTIHVAISGHAATSLGFYSPSSPAWQSVTTTGFTADNDAMALSFTGQTANASSGIDLVTVSSP